MINDTLKDCFPQTAFPVWESFSRLFGLPLERFLAAQRRFMKMPISDIQQTLGQVGSPEQFNQFHELLKTASTLQHVVGELAYAMWEDGGRQVGVALDSWLSAERHVYAMWVAIVGTTGNEVENAPAKLDSFSVVEYMEGIRRLAYELWWDAQKPAGQALKFWLKAEEQVLGTIATTTGPSFQRSDD